MSGELTNSDFRLIFDNYEKEKKERENNLLLKERKKLKRKEKYLTRKKKNEEKEEQKYRDRAEERRKGIVKDVKDASVLYDNANNTIDESKFMGGDTEHTHLVKGLDYLLLNKVRNKLIDKISSERKKLKVNKTDNGPVANKIPTFSNDESRHIFKYFFLYEHPHHVYFKRKIENIYGNIMNNMKFKNYNRNIYSVNYKYNINMEVDKNDVPIRYIYKVEDVKVNYTYHLEASVLDEIDVCFKWHMENKKKKKNERLPKRPLTANFFRQEQNYELGQGEDDDDVDIFKNDGDEMGGGGEPVNSAAIAPDVANVGGNRVGGSADGEDEADGDDSDDDDDDEDDEDEDDGSDDGGSGSSSAIGVHTEGRRKEQYGKDGNKRVQQDGGSNRSLFYSKKLPDTGKVGTENRSNKDSLSENIFKDTYDECYPGY
ncbi:RED-like protein, putative [Plasmodium knowlesi strain H]|uniref:RED-like protein, putative n=3 Tax=Plasmodium knowlesi TaxID=5850 RepID=A0A5K1U3I4_PLAKH|nr:RED-like protein, putative [Plasmodium knowlesi strain H]OTN63705.1 putative RED-like protein [Plasmodium knowlesi]CAA9990670.1 RED-like protein, putative [Plasmodium knowlesi strain H]SBO25951.1 RED-like protein, putative [Plasmodium knowlesi strain H]SBO28688.1 RED-like protein, putative [Plasmodium knowlesi strain H]VVS80144.1 RED-like protein, putative [Plasmodium knowlesi strain H]|eukprot:XP_002261961.1 RED-like protein, putative [Plasmodium knowlesi strain H]